MWGCGKNIKIARVLSKCVNEEVLKKYELCSLPN